MNKVEAGIIFERFENLAKKNIPVTPDDYEENGLIYCGKCRTPKQCEVIVFEEVRKPYCLCKCMIEKKEREEREQKARERQERINKMRHLGFPEAEMTNWTFAADDGENNRISKIAMNYVENFEEMRKRGKGLLLYGTVGTGKTFAAACIANALIDRGIPCLVTNFARLVNTIGGMFEGKQQYIDSLNQYDLVVIDDLSSERDTEYMNEIVYMIIDSRYRAGLPTIVTTNLTAEEIKSPADIRKQRIYSRIREMTIPVEVVGTDRRNKKLAGDYKDLKDLLGL